MASLPQPSDQDWDIIAERGAKVDVSPDHMGYSAAGVSSRETSPALVYEEVPVVQRNKDVKPSAVTEPSASEEQLREEQKWWRRLGHNIVLHTSIEALHTREETLI